MARSEYQRLTRSHSRRFFSPAVRSRISLGLGSDHLLFIDTNGYTENYKRFYFRDIQALTLQVTARSHITNVVLSILTILFVLLGLIAQVPGLRVFGFICAGIFGLFLLINWWLGPTCCCQLRTAVQTEELSSLVRVRQAQKIFARLQPLIVAAQGGDVSPEMITAQLVEPAPAPVLSPAAAEEPPSAASEPTL